MMTADRAGRLALRPEGDGRFYSKDAARWNLFRGNKKTPRFLTRSVAGGKGFEPLHTDPESAVLPARRTPKFETVRG